MTLEEVQSEVHFAPSPLWITIHRFRKAAYTMTVVILASIALMSFLTGKLPMDGIPSATVFTDYWQLWVAAGMTTTCFFALKRMETRTFLVEYNYYYQTKRNDWA